MMSSRGRLAGHVARVEAVRKTFKILVGKLESKKPFERPRCTREDNIKLYFPLDNYNMKTPRVCNTYYI
jgi:hypothetical protein